MALDATDRAGRDADCRSNGGCSRIVVAGGDCQVSARGHAGGRRHGSPSAAGPIALSIQADFDAARQQPGERPRHRRRSARTSPAHSPTASPDPRRRQGRAKRHGGSRAVPMAEHAPAMSRISKRAVARPSHASRTSAPARTSENSAAALGLSIADRGRGQHQSDRAIMRRQPMRAFQPAVGVYLVTRGSAAWPRANASRVSRSRLARSAGSSFHVRGHGCP